MIKVGDKLPAKTLLTVVDNHLEKVDLVDCLKGKKVILFGFPGAFTTICTSVHIPPFVALSDKFKEKGIDEIFGVAVNDPAVLAYLSQVLNANGKVTFLSDWDAAFTKEMGLAYDDSDVGLGIRSMRYSAIVDDGVLSHIVIEQRPGECLITKADLLLKYI